MADITMCSAKNCKSEKSCYRKTATITSQWQAWADFSDGKEIEKCDDFYEIFPKEKRIKHKN